MEMSGTKQKTEWDGDDFFFVCFHPYLEVCILHYVTSDILVIQQRMVIGKATRAL